MKTKEKNLCGKTRKIDNPYEVWSNGSWEWRVLKKYQKPSLEAKNPYARWFCAVKSPYTMGSWEMGDTYVKDVKRNARKVELMKKEFKIGDIVTLDRYNHIDDVEKVPVIGYGEMLSGTLTYKMNVRGTIIESTGRSIMESKHYTPVPDEDRHPRKPRIFKS